MDADDDEIIHDAENFIRVYKSGRVERFLPINFAPASTDATTGISSKDVVIVPESGVSARIYLPPLPVSSERKLPVLVYFHGGGFCLGSAFDIQTHCHLSTLVAKAKAIAVSVEYRLAPEQPVPSLYDDAWAALEWLALHANGHGQEPWLTNHADFENIHVGGESAGANIAHHMAMRAGSEQKLNHGLMKIKGVVLVHPYFLGSGRLESELSDPVTADAFVQLWKVVCPGATGCDDRWINPMAADAPSLSGLGCGRVLVCVGEKDVIRDRGRLYCDKVKGSGFGGEVEIWEAQGEGHGFHLFKPDCEQTSAQVSVIAEFVNRA